MTAQSTYNRQSEARSIAAGKRRIPGGLLSKEAAGALAWLIEHGYEVSQARVIGRALVEAKGRVKT